MGDQQQGGEAPGAPSEGDGSMRDANATAVVAIPGGGGGGDRKDSGRALPEPKPSGEADPIKAPKWVGLLGALIVFAVAALRPALTEADKATRYGYWAEVLTLFFAELGVALIVAYIIGWGIDEQAKRREQRIQAAKEEQERLRQALEKQAEQAREERERQETLEREKRMTQDVFRGVLGIQHSSEYVRKVIESTLDRKIIRRQVTLMYKLSRLTADDAAELGVADPTKFMFLDQAFTFEFENLSSDKLPLPVKFALPARHGPKLRSASRVLSATIGGKAQNVESALGGDLKGDAKVYTWPHEIGPHGKLTVAVTARVIKEDSDSEVWCSYFPCTEGMSLQVTAPDDLHVGMRNNTASQETLEMPASGNGMAVWKIDGPILPHNSVVFYWRTPEHDGDAPVPGLVPAVAPAKGEPGQGPGASAEES